MKSMKKVYLERLKALRNEGVPTAYEFEQHGILNMSGWASCLLSAWAVTDYAQNDGWTLLNEGGVSPSYEVPYYNGYHGFDAACTYFGLRLGDCLRLFTGNSNITIEHRVEFLDKLIEERTSVFSFILSKLS